MGFNPLGPPRRSAGTGRTCAVGPYRIGLGEQRDDLAAVLLPNCSSDNRSFTSVSAVPGNPVQHRRLAGQFVDVGGLPGIDRAAGLGQNLGVANRRLDDIAFTETSCPPTHLRTPAGAQPSRTARCDGASKLPGTWNAIHAPGASSPAHRTTNSACPGTHCSAALDTTTSVSGCGAHAARSPTTRVEPALAGRVRPSPANCRRPR